jgi:S-formylglutathione hydrolase FrmB
MVELRGRVMWGVRVGLGLMAQIAVILVATGLHALAGGHVLEGQSIASPTLGRPIPYVAYVPTASAASGTLPALYLLHGRGDTERAWVDNADIAATLDHEIASGSIQPLVVIMPAAGNSWYVDDAQPGRFGNIAKAFTSDLITGAEARLPSIARCRNARAVGGLSMGGYGAILYAVDRPDLYAGAFSLSGSLFRADAASIEARRGAYERIYGGVHGAPFDPQRFLTWNVFHKLDATAAPARLPPVWLSAGERDFPAILDGTKHLHEELRRRGASSALTIADGAHTWTLWAREIVPALRWLSPKLTGACAG